MTRTTRRYLNARMRRELGFNRGSANRWLNTRFVAHLTANLNASEPCRMAGQLTVRELRAIFTMGGNAL